MFQRLLRLAVPAVFAGLVSVSATLAADGTDVPIPRIAPHAAATIPSLPDDALPFTTTAQAEPTLRPTSDGTDDDALGSGDGVIIDPTAEGGLAPDVGPPSEIRPGTFTLEARMTPDGGPLGEGVHWRIYGDKPGTDGHLPLLGEADGGIVYIRLDQGSYFVHAAYGRAGATRKLDVSGPTGGEVVVLNAGGMRLLALNGEDVRLNPGEVSFDIYAPDEGGSEERFLLIPNAPPGKIVALNAGTYHVVSKYGDANAVVRADVKVEPGKLTEATIYQEAARLTFKLVEQHGGEALADTAWTVTTPDGATIAEMVGAFPSMVLSAGDYTAFAQHSGRRFQTNFTVSANAHRDIEVLAE